MKMVTSGHGIVAFLGLILLSAGITNVKAQDSAKSAPASKIDISGFVEAYYSKNFNSLSNRMNQLRNFDIYENQFGLNLAKLTVQEQVQSVDTQSVQQKSAQTNVELEGATAPPTGLLMSALGKAGMVEPLNEAGINIYGYVEGGYFHDFTAPSANAGPTFIGFNIFKDEAILDKVSLNIERTVDPTKKKFDLGFRVEGIYCADAAFIHSNGMMDSQTGRNQWDLLQGYVDVTFPNLPVRLRVGKWIELAGFEQFSANIYGAFGDPARALYSYSYQFLYAEPGTQTGALLTYVLNPRWTLDAGFTRGWNQSLRDANGALDFLGRVTFIPSDKTAITFVMTEGPEFPTGAGRNLPPGDNNDWWTALDLVITQKITDELSLGLGFDYVDAPHIPGLTGSAKQWGGVAGYVSYAFDPHFTLNTRLEWYKDVANGFSTGAPVVSDYYEPTVGLAINPLPNNNILSHFLVRPEVRYDYSSQPIFAGGDHSQLTFSVDALFIF